MHHEPIKIKRALISVSDKTGLVDFARQLSQMNIEIISTGGTSKLLQSAQIPCKDVSEVSGFPEIMDGRVKTLHPKIHGGILGLRDQHAEIAKQHQIEWIDLVIVNLYPFAQTIQNPDCDFDHAIENIDIGGPTMIRSAAKNMGWVSVVVDPSDYALLAQELSHNQAIGFATRRQLAAKAFSHTAHYDSIIEKYLQTQTEAKLFPEQIQLSLQKYADLRYGENPHQAAAAYHLQPTRPGVLSAKQHQGKLLSYNNIADADAALACVQEFNQPACVIVKHANPCGVALADTIEEAYQKAFAADSLSAFGGIVALNRACNKTIAQALSSIFMEVLIAPEFSDEALALLAQKPNLRVLELKLPLSRQNVPEFKFIQGGLLLQEPDQQKMDLNQLRLVTQQAPEPALMETMIFAWQVLKHLKSNAILLARDRVTLGVGTGQVSRIDSVELALRKAGNNFSGAVLASDAFFPFRDSIDFIANFSKSLSGAVRAIIQPGGSVKDEEVIQACNEHGIAMIFTGQRCFKH